MNEIKEKLEQLRSIIIQQTMEINNLRNEQNKLIMQSKIDRSDRLLTAKDVKKEKFGGIGDDKFQKILDDPTFPRIRLHNGAHLKFSDKAIDAWIINKQNSIL